MAAASKNRNNAKLKEKILISWEAPARPFKRRGRDSFATLIAAAGLLGFIVFIIEGWLPVILIISLVFLFYILSTVEPDNLKYAISEEGIKIEDKILPWEMVTRFWFTRRFDHDLLVIETLTLPGRTEIVIKEIKPEDLQRILSDYILHETKPGSYIDRASSWFDKKLSEKQVQK